MENRRKIVFYNQHFAYISKELYDVICVEKNINDFNEYVKKEAKRQFEIEIKEASDISKLTGLIKDNYYDSPSDWIREKVRADLKLSGYKYYIDEMICLNSIQTKGDIEEARKNGYLKVEYTAAEIKVRFPLLDINKVFFNNTDWSVMVYYDKNKYAMCEIPAGYPLDKNKSIENYSIMVHPDFDKSEEYSILMYIDYIYSALLEKNYEYFKYLNMPLYVNEIFDNLIRNTGDKMNKKELIKVRGMNIGG